MVRKKRNVDESTTNAHLSEALTKESDRSAFRPKPQAKKADETNDKENKSRSSPGPSAHVVLNADSSPAQSNNSDAQSVHRSPSPSDDDSAPSSDSEV